MPSLPEPLDLLIEQEGAIDALYAKIASELAAALDTQGETVNVRATDAAVRNVLNKYFGANRAEAANSPIGKLVRDYANAGRRQALQDGAIFASPKV